MNFPEVNYIVLMEFGSHLYGTSDESSDTDIKGVFTPTREQVYLSQIPEQYHIESKSNKGEGVKNTSEDVDIEVYSLHKFIQLAEEGQTVALDMLHAPSFNIIRCSSIWEAIVANKEKFFTKNFQAFVGYARKQAAKYGLKGSRLNEAKEFNRVCKQYSSDTEERLEKIWDKIPIGEHIKIVEIDPQGFPQVQVCGKKFNTRTKICFVYDVMSKFVKEYGARSVKAANNEGVDWKAMSHACRAALEVKELLTDNTITFPLKDAENLKAIKHGDYPMNKVLPYLEDLMSEVEKLAEYSTLPDKPDKEFWDKFIVDTLEWEFK